MITDNQSCTEPKGHCYHYEGYTLMSHPPQYPKKCCHCGHKVVERGIVSTIPPGHGPFAPSTDRYTL